MIKGDAEWRKRNRKKIKRTITVKGSKKQPHVPGEYRILVTLPDGKREWRWFTP